MLEVDRLTITFPAAGPSRRSQSAFRAVDEVSFRVEKGKTTGLVGESGSGKSSIARAIVRLTPVTSGRILFHGTDIVPMTEREFRPYRRRIQMVFQDPFGSLNPRRTVLETLAEPQEIHFPDRSRTAMEDRAADLLRLVGLPADALRRRPREFSGGQRQRIGIARALAVEPELLICDEAVSALDVSIQAQIVNLLQDLQESLGLTCLFIGHDLAVVEHISDHILVLHRGRLVESGPAAEVCSRPAHPYTQSLLAAIPTF